MMRLLSTFLLAATLSASCLAQAPASPTPSATLKPAIDNIQQTLILLRPEKWKINEAIGKETASNLASIQADLQTTLPPLLAVADEHPDSIAQVLPAFRNISALYDVLLRVTQVATITAPSQQSAALLQSLAALESAKRDLGEGLQATALTQNQQLHDLQSQLRSAQANAAPAPAPCPPEPAPAASPKKHRPKPKPAAAPATTPPAAPASQ